MFAKSQVWALHKAFLLIRVRTDPVGSLLTLTADTKLRHRAVRKLTKASASREAELQTNPRHFLRPTQAPRLALPPHIPRGSLD